MARCPKTARSAGGARLAWIHVSPSEPARALSVTPPEPATPPPAALPRQEPRWAALAAVAVTVFAWASAFVVLRVSAPAFGPGPLTELRLLVGVAALGAFVLAGRRWVTPNRREWASSSKRSTLV